MSTIQPGRHTVTVTAAEVGESKKKSTPGVFFEFRNEEGETIDGSLWLTESCLERTINTLREAFGFNDDFTTLSDQCVGKECSITVEMEADQNDATKEWPRVKWINPIRTTNKPAAGGLLASLSAKAKAIARPAGAPPPNPKTSLVARPPAAPKPATPPIDEDVPF